MYQYLRSEISRQFSTLRNRCHRSRNHRNRTIKNTLNSPLLTCNLLAFNFKSNSTLPTVPIKSIFLIIVEVPIIYILSAPMQFACFSSEIFKTSIYSLFFSRTLCCGQIRNTKNEEERIAKHLCEFGRLKK